MEKLCVKYSAGNFAILCSDCRDIIKVGYDFSREEKDFATGRTDDLPPQYCEKCKPNDSNSVKETALEAAGRIYPFEEGYGVADINSQMSDLKAAFVEGAEWQKEQIVQFLLDEITERRPYSASKMCEKIIEFINK